MRPAVLLIIAIFTLVPALLMMFSEGRPLARRLLLGVLIFLAPFVLIVAVQLVPAFNGTSPNHGQAWRAVGVFFRRRASSCHGRCLPHCAGSDAWAANILTLRMVARIRLRHEDDMPTPHPFRCPVRGAMMRG